MSFAWYLTKYLVRLFSKIIAGTMLLTVLIPISPMIVFYCIVADKHSDWKQRKK